MCSYTAIMCTTQWAGISKIVKLVIHNVVKPKFKHLQKAWTLNQFSQKWPEPRYPNLEKLNFEPFQTQVRLKNWNTNSPEPSKNPEPWTHGLGSTQHYFKPQEVALYLQFLAHCVLYNYIYYVCTISNSHYNHMPCGLCFALVIPLGFVI